MSQKSTGPHIFCPDCGSENMEENIGNADFQCRDCGWWGDRDEVSTGPQKQTGQRGSS